MPSIPIRSLLLAAAASTALAAGSVSAVAADTREDRPATAADSGSAEDSADAYRSRMGEEVDRWKGKVESFSSDAREKGTEAGKAAADEVENAWDKVKSEWSNLQGASDDTWQKTKAAFERAWDDFQEAWRSATNS